MAHIHTKPNEHDLTISFYIILEIDNEPPKILVHMHRKLGKLMQLGGHVELLENPWQAAAHEIVEESGFSLEELILLQPFDTPPSIRGTVVHPTPAVSLTFKNSETHFHTDLSYALIANSLPTKAPLEGESNDLRWLTLAEYQVALENNESIEDVYDIYHYALNELLPKWDRVPASLFSLQSPDHLAF